MTPDRPIKSVVIVGGGTAGWLTAGTLASALQARVKSGELSITLCESPDIPIVGVGEGTWPTMRETLQSFGVSETDFFRECEASFKQGSKFVRWRSDEEGVSYHHPFASPQNAATGQLAEYWLSHRDAEPYARMFGWQEALGEAGLAPKAITTPEYSFVLAYGYHLNAGAFSAFLQKHCVSALGVRHVLANVEQVEQDESGYITAITTDAHGSISGDLFVDCTGFRSLLLGDTLGVGFEDKSDILFADTALALQVPYRNDDDPIASFTIATAQEAGWIWDIGLPTRRGVGHVFSSRYMSVDKATALLLDYVKQSGGDTRDLSPREINFKTGHRTRLWEKNCVGVGLSAGFLEPLEASALVLVELSARVIARHFPRTWHSLPIVGRRFNELFLYRWSRIIDFLKLHYVLNARHGQGFWDDNRSAESIPEQLAELMSLWQHSVPVTDDFFHAREVFQATSYHYIMYGSGFETDPIFAQPRAIQEIAERTRAASKTETAQLMSQLPTNRQLLNNIVNYGMPKA